MAARSILAVTPRVDDKSGVILATVVGELVGSGASAEQSAGELLLADGTGVLEGLVLVLVDVDEGAAGDRVADVEAASDVVSETVGQVVLVVDSGGTDALASVDTGGSDGGVVVKDGVVTVDAAVVVTAGALGRLGGRGRRALGRLAAVTLLALGEPRIAVVVAEVLVTAVPRGLQEEAE